jgi:hypothetical protein
VDIGEEFSSTLGVAPPRWSLCCSDVAWVVGGTRSRSSGETLGVIVEDCSPSCPTGDDVELDWVVGVTLDVLDMVRIVGIVTKEIGLESGIFDFPKSEFSLGGLDNFEEGVRVEVEILPE